MNKKTGSQVDFYWTGISYEGKKISGSIYADNLTEAKKILIKNHAVVLTVSKKPNHFYQHKKLTLKNKLDFLRQLHLLLKIGIALGDALNIIYDHTTDTITKNLIKNIAEDLSRGMSLSSIFSKNPRYFNVFFCRLIATGEQSGQLDQALSILIKNQEYQLELKSKIIKTLFYPTSVLVVSTLITIGVLIFIIPQFKSLYANFNSKLPKMTQVIIEISQWMSAHWIFLSAAFIFTIFLIKKYNQKIKLAILKSLFYIPVFKNLLIIGITAKWSQLISMCLSANMQLIDALNLASKISLKSPLGSQLSELAKAVSSGKPLHVALGLCPDFPKRAKTLIAIAENADALTEMMQKITLTYQAQLHDHLDRLSKLLEPVIMMLVASLVSGLVIALYLPIFKMGNVI